MGTALEVTNSAKRWQIRQKTGQDEDRDEDRDRGPKDEDGYEYP